MSGKRKKMPFGVLWIWRTPTNHLTDCYFCLALPKSGQKSASYPSIASSIAPACHNDNIPVPVAPSSNALFDDDDQDSMSDVTDQSGFESNFDAVSGIKTVDKSLFDNYVSAWAKQRENIGWNRSSRVIGYVPSCAGIFF